MNFEDKLKELRKNKNISQEELANVLYVSRTAVSKWESGKGFPSIDTLKALADFYGVTIDSLLSNDELLEISKKNIEISRKSRVNLIIGLLDLFTVCFFFLPIFSKVVDDKIYSVLIFNLNSSPLVFILYYLFIVITILNGIATLCLLPFDVNLSKHRVPTSLVLTTLLLLVFILTRQVYASCLALAILIIKFVLFIKK